MKKLLFITAMMPFQLIGAIIGFSHFGIVSGFIGAQASMRKYISTWKGKRQNDPQPTGTPATTV